MSENLGVSKKIKKSQKKKALQPSKSGLLFPVGFRQDDSPSKSGLA